MARVVICHRRNDIGISWKATAAMMAVAFFLDHAF